MPPEKRGRNSHTRDLLGDPLPYARNSSTRKAAIGFGRRLLFEDRFCGLEHLFRRTLNCAFRPRSKYRNERVFIGFIIRRKINFLGVRI